ncbi:MAG: lytic murein transglycosylase [Rhodobacteraceae bacterium]|nr:lytic murein transglycosylase [Paracoccaceae bacterium]
MKRCWLACVVVVLLPHMVNASVVPCGGSFESFVENVRQEGIGRGHDPAMVDSFLQHASHDPEVIRRDNAQGIFKRSFIDFSTLVMSDHRIVKGREFRQRHGAELQAVFERYGVQPGVLLAFLALETDYGVVQGDFNTLNSLITLSHDCRRPELFQPHLFAAMKLFGNGSFDPVETQGAWAGEIGMIQLLPEDILQFGTDADGDGKVDLRGSAADALMTAGRVLNSFGWQPREPWLIEILVPESLDWAETGVRKPKTLEEWRALGVSPRSGNWPALSLEASILLPHGRKGPAFFAFSNFNVYLEWNRSLVYATTSAFFATLLSGEPLYLKGNPPPQLTNEEIVWLQSRLVELGHDVGGVDGIVGSMTRAAVQNEQVRLGIPADAWPTSELIALLR